MTDDAAELPDGYNLAFRFRGESASQRAYFSVQELVERDASDLELSVYRLQRRDDWLVILVGDAPDKEFEDQVRSVLLGGQVVVLEDALLRSGIPVGAFSPVRCVTAVLQVNSAQLTYPLKILVPGEEG